MSGFESNGPLMIALLVVAVPVVIVLVVFIILLPFLVTLGLAELGARAGGLAVDVTGALGLPGRLGAFVLGVPKFALMMFKSLRRNLVRTSLTYLATFAGVIVVAFIWSVLGFLDNVMTERAKDVKVIVTEKFQIPSQMPPSYEPDLAAEAVGLGTGLGADPTKDLMSWAFVGCSTDPDKRTLETILFFFAMDPKALQTMMDDLEPERLGAADRAMMARSVAEMQTNIQAIIVGEERLRSINKKVGERIKVFCFNYRDIDFELEIVGTFPRGRYDQSAVMNVEYFRRSLDAYQRAKGERHPLADKSMNLFWARFPEKEGYERYAEAIARPGRFASPAVKVEMASSAIASFLDAYKDILRAMRWLLAPAILAVIVLVIAIAYSIGVRERQQEMAILKVLGFRPWQILVLILGEAVLVGALSGAIATVSAWYLVNQLIGGVPLPIGFFPKFKVADAALWWGPAVGALAAIAGCFIPAWSARRVRVTEVFSRIA